MAFDGCSSKMTYAFISAMVLSCQEAPPDPGSTQLAPAAKTPKSNTGTIRIFPSSFWPGKSNVPTTARLAFAMERTSGEPQNHAPLLASNAIFRSEAAGKKVSAKVEASEEKGNPSLAFFYFEPLEELQPDTWYFLELSQSSGVQVLDGDGAPTVGTWSQPFFTGSAPQISRIEVIQKSAQVRVEFSEPIEAKDLTASKVLSVGGGALAKCLYWAGECTSALGADGPILRELVFQLSGPAGAPGASPSIEVVLPAGVKGSPRTIGEGKDIAATSWTPTPAGELRFSSAGGKWSSCQQGAAECWAYER